MKTEARHERVSELFAEACELPLEERRAFLEARCRGDAGLVNEVLDLLERDRSSAGPIPAALRPRSGDSSPSDELLERLSAHRPKRSRYQLLGEIARGGMGAILKVWDADLRRHLAMKVVLGRTRDEPLELTPDVEERVLERFLEEAQITGQLDHPGIVPVHELGLDDHGRVFFTMRLVKGSDLKEILEKMRAELEGWTPTRVLGVLLKACEAMAFAHSRGVVHRDLKPSNVMVGRFGETYVMDWGLGRVLEREDHRDLRPRERAVLTASLEPEANPSVRTYRDDDSDEQEAQLVTQDGEVIGTPAYMSPEQARGELTRVGPASDVYSLGAILYEFLTGYRPFDDHGSGPRALEVWRRVIERPPPPIHDLARKAPPELVAICEKAMARDVTARYADASELADDLRAYLENRVVKAHRRGPAAELKKWIARNRLAAAALAAIVLLAIAAGFVLAAQERARRVEVERGLDAHLVSRLLAEAHDLWPIDEARRRQLAAWRQQASELVAELPAYRRELEAFEALHADAVRLAVPPSELSDEFPILDLETRRHELGELAAAGQTPHDHAIFEIELEGGYLDREIAALHARRAELTTWKYADPALASVHGQLTSIVLGLESLTRETVGGIDILEERERASRLPEDFATAWRRARASIADAAECPAYGGLDLAPQEGLVPLERDPESGLWEFWHVASGSRPKRGVSGAWRIQHDTGIVLILVPGGEVWIGAQSSDPAGHNYADSKLHFPEDPARIYLNEGPVHQVVLSPYFLSKYELTQGQWHRATYANPSKHYAGADYDGEQRLSRTHPVEGVSWRDCRAVLGRWNLSLPTEAQWESAARAGNEAPFWGVDGTFASVMDAINFADQTLTRRGIPAAIPGPHSDGYGVHAPVDAFGPNPMGFFGITGNVWEWCLDWFCQNFRQGEEESPGHTRLILPGTGEHVPDLSVGKVVRGGSFASGPINLRVSRRQEWIPTTVWEDLGVRPAREFDP